MAKISQYGSIGTIDPAADVIAIVDTSGNTTNKATIDQLGAVTQTLSNKTLMSPAFAGTSTYATTHSEESTVYGDIQTSSTSPATVVSYTMADETLVVFDVLVGVSRRTNVTKGGRYKRSFVYRRTGGGAPTIVGAVESSTDQETTAGDDVTIDVSSNDVRVRFTAADSDGRNIIGILHVLKVLAT